MEQYFRLEYIKRAVILLTIINDRLEEHLLFTFSKIGVNIDKLDTCHRLGSTDRTIVKLLNWKNAMKLLGNKNKLKYVDMYERSSKENNDKNFSSNQASVSKQVKDRKSYGYKKTKSLINESFCPYRGMLYVKIKELTREGLADLF